MTPKVRALVGVMTTLVFLGLGGMLYAEQRYPVAGLLGALGVFRGVFAARQWMASIAPEDPE